MSINTIACCNIRRDCVSSAQTCHAIFCNAGFAVFALFIMPMLKLDPNEYKEYMGEKAQGSEAIAGSSTNEGTKRLQ